MSILSWFRNSNKHKFSDEDRQLSTTMKEINAQNKRLEISLNRMLQHQQLVSTIKELKGIDGNDEEEQPLNDLDKIMEVVGKFQQNKEGQPNLMQLGTNPKVQMLLNALDKIPEDKLKNFIDKLIK